MKKLKFVSVILVFIIFCFSSIFLGCTADNIFDGPLLRLHIRANSDSDADQAVKLEVRDAVNAFIVENISASDFSEAYDAISAALDDIERTASAVTSAAGFAYGASARLVNEYFPARKYGDTVVPDGCYDALIIELGEGVGANWWCVVYPPLCYGSELPVYKSFFAELFG